MTTVPLKRQHAPFLGSIRVRLLGIIVLFGLALIAIVAALSWFAARDIYAGRQDELRTVVEVASKAVQQQYDEFKKGTISEAEAQQRAKASLRAMRYNSNDYIFALDKDLAIIIHGTRPDLEGTDGSKSHDVAGKYFNVDMHKVATEQGQGFVNYEYAKPGAPMDQPSPKLSYVKQFAPWQWSIATGVYIDDIEATVWSRVLWTAATALAMLIVIGGFGGVIMFRLSNRLNALSEAMTALAAGDSDVALPAVAGADEVGAMTRAVQVFKANAAERERLEAEALANRTQTERERERVAAERAKAAEEQAEVARSVERERERAAAERAKAAEEQAEVVRRLGAGLKDLAGGDLMVRLSEGFTPAYAIIRDDFNEAIDRLRTTILSVVESASAIRTGAQEVSTASDDLAHRAEQQAANLEQTTATLGEVTTAVKKSAEGTNHARQVVTAAETDAKQSAVVVREAVDAMGTIAKSSQKISQIIGVIDEIAFQTNLLALNAGVEAARAGEAGRGFAVVASEVRGLAQRSAEAAKEIKGLISESAGQVDKGVDLVADTGRSLGRILEQVTEINVVVGEIAAAAQEQSTALHEINTAIEEMNHVTQQNAAMVEESTAAGHSLSDESSRLAELVGQFRVRKSTEERSLARAA